MRSNVARATLYSTSAWIRPMYMGPRARRQSNGTTLLGLQRIPLRKHQGSFQITQIWKNSEGSYTTWTSWQRTRQRQAGAFGSRNGPSLELQAALGHAINLCKCNLQIPKLRHNFRRWSPLCKAAISLCLLRRFARSSRRQPPPRSPPRACIRL